ncbi:MAG: hypothetical protein K5898_00895 [Ruminococcus sp.]|uniref:D-alanyl-D-alanine carboxypeptidase family protein n=1 Tax=Ruminococcus sp. TaxID=41978 RepID=UPI0025DD63E0|nr:hypothetical protein [Ruminococcus sp.]MCR4793740.1 hypothetical protein [Ruminococcus sp.]
MTKITDWIKEHRKLLLITLIAILFADILLIVIFSSKSDDKPEPKAAEKEYRAAAEITEVTSVAEVSQPAEQNVNTEPKNVSEKKSGIDTDYLPYCKASAVYSLKKGEFLYSNNINEETAPASLTKLLTASVALKYADADDVFTAGSELAYVNENSSLAGLAVGDSLTLRDLITGMFLASGNDAARTVAVNVARMNFPDADLNDVEAVNCFCGLMEQFAKSIGMENSNFVSPDGWDKYDQYTTVSDLIKLTEYVMSVPELRDIVAMPQKTVYSTAGKVFTWQNSNQLLDINGNYYCENAIGVKTGTTQNAGSCLISAFETDDDTYISVVVGCNTDNDRYDYTLNMIYQIL